MDFVMRDATVLAVHDGDTVTADVEFPYAPHKRVVETMILRLRGIQAAEIEAKDAQGVPDLPARAKAQKAQQFLSSMVLNQRVRIHLYGFDKYGPREDAEIFLNGLSVNSQMVSQGQAVVWNGKGPKPSGV